MRKVPAPFKANDRSNDRPSGTPRESRFARWVRDLFARLFRRP